MRVMNLTEYSTHNGQRILLCWRGAISAGRASKNNGLARDTDRSNKRMGLFFAK